MNFQIIDFDEFECIETSIPKKYDADSFIAGANFILNKLDAQIKKNKTYTSAEWIVKTSNKAFDRCECSNCGSSLNIQKDSKNSICFCPFCGRQMKGI